MSKELAMIKRSTQQVKTFDSLYEEFILSRKAQNLRPATIDYYYWHLRPLKTYMEKNNICYIQDMDKCGMDAYILWLRSNHDNDITVNAYLRAVRAFLYYAMGRNYINHFKIKLLRQESPIKEVYSEDEIKKLLEKQNLYTRTFAEYRNWVLVQYFLETGNRLNTVINIKVADVDLQVGMVVLRRNKNRKQMYSPLGKAMLEVLVEYVKEWGLNPDDYLFPNVERKQLSKNAIQNTLAKYNKGRGVEKTSIHAFRHTFAKNYVMKGGNAFKLQALLGHSTLEITRRYIALFGEDLAADFDKYSIIDEHSRKKRMTRS